MADFNKILTPGAIDEGVIHTVVEIPQGSTLKIEWNRELAVFQIDRVEPGIFAKPVNYGFIPQTLDDDGDELDTLIICHEPIPTGVFVEARIIGVMEFEDDGEMDHKIVCVPADDRHTGNAIKSLTDLPEAWTKQVAHHFTHYKDLKSPGKTNVMGWGDVTRAKEVIAECIERWNNK